MAANQCVDVSMDVAESIELPVERARMERVFANLIDNALGAMPGGGSLRIGAVANGASVVVSVEDSGPGIAPNIRPRLFEPFATFGKKNGVGLGLALSRQTVADHGGEMWLETACTAGARLSLRLPLGAARA